MFTVANAVLVALVQVGVIVLSILGAGLTSRIFKDLPLPAVTKFLVHYGFILMAFPLLWITTAIWIRIRKDVDEDAKTLVFFCGIGLAVMLLFFGGYGTVKPWLSVDFAFRGTTTESE
jgi:hypothetical protein